MRRWTWLVALLYGLHIIGTGLWRGIEARAYKPNALWFCLVMGLTCIAGAYLLRLGRRRAGLVTTGVVFCFVFGFYAYCFVAKPEDDATVRVGLILLSSIASLALLHLPEPPPADPATPD